MSFLEKIRTRFHEAWLKRNLARPSGPVRSFNLDSAETIGILFDGTEKPNREAVLEFAEKLKKEGKKVKLLSYLHSKIETGNFTFPCITPQQLDWVLRPTAAEVQEFTDQPFDLLLNLSPWQRLPLEYVAARSKAKFRVGAFTEKTFCYDLMIEPGSPADVRSLLQQVIFYLKKMRSTHESTVS